MKYDEAILILQSLITETAQTDSLNKVVYHNLVQTYREKGDVNSAVEVAKEALDKWPDLTAGTRDFIDKVDGTYAIVRSTSYGSLNVATTPESCSVFVDGQLAGHSPVAVNYLKVGTHDLLVVRPGYKNKIVTVMVDPGVTKPVPVSLSKRRDSGWWLTRIAIPAAALAAGVIAMSTRNGSESKPGSLSKPPAPPGY
jgi:hypothetical protein